MNISENDTAQDLALEGSPHFRLKPKTAERITSELKQAITEWVVIAGAVVISRGEIDDVRSA